MAACIMVAQHTTLKLTIALATRQKYRHTPPDTHSHTVLLTSIAYYLRLTILSTIQKKPTSITATQQTPNVTSLVQGKCNLKRNELPRHLKYSLPLNFSLDMPTPP